VYLMPTLRGFPVEFCNAIWANCKYLVLCEMAMKIDAKSLKVV